MASHCQVSLVVMTEECITSTYFRCKNSFSMVVLLFLLSFQVVVGDVLDGLAQVKPCSHGEDCGHELFLSSFLDSGRISDGKEAAKVKDILPGVLSYSGYFTVNETLGSNMFFWFFPAETGSRDAPVVLWLSGGPGDAFAYTLFELNGPYIIVEGPKLIPNLLYWSQSVNVLYVDNPVGTGFSFIKTSGAISEREIERNLFSVIHQFFQLFPEYRENEFFVIGNSYGGRYATALAHMIHENNPASRLKINLKGLAIGSGWIDPINQIDYSGYLYYLGLIDLTTKQEFASTESQIKSLIKKEDFKKAQDMLDKYFLGKFVHPSLAENVTGFRVWNNYLVNHQPLLLINGIIDDFINNASWRKSMHVGDIGFNSDYLAAYKHHRSDFLKSVAPRLESLMDHYRVLLFNGQLDVLCPYPLAINYVRKLNWTGAEEYRNAKRKQWHVLGDLAGYAKTAGNFTELLVRDVGHQVLQNRLPVIDMIMRFTRNIPFDAPIH